MFARRDVRNPRQKSGTSSRHGLCLDAYHHTFFSDKPGRTDQSSELSGGGGGAEPQLRYFVGCGAEGLTLRLARRADVPSDSMPDAVAPH